MLDKSGGFRTKLTALYYGTQFQYIRRDFEFYKKDWFRPDLDSMKEGAAKFLEMQDPLPGSYSRPGSGAGGNK